MRDAEGALSRDSHQAAVDREFDAVDICRGGLDLEPLNADRLRSGLWREETDLGRRDRRDGEESESEQTPHVSSEPPPARNVFRM